MDYKDVVLSKQIKSAFIGIDIPKNALDHASYLDDFQKAVVLWALRKGKAAIFADCGLGKTRMQLEWLNQIHKLHPDKTSLILAPLAVTDQTAREGADIGISVNACDTQEDVKLGVNITNYESLHKFQPDLFIAIVLDESSILKAFDGKTTMNLISQFANTPYRLACTATPSPNDVDELGNHSEFLGIMSLVEMRMRWFINCSERSNTFRLKKHAVKSFWEWVGTWAVCFGKPSDIGDYNDAKFQLPALKINEIIIDVDQTQGAEDGQFFRIADMSATSMHEEMRLTADARARKAADIVNASNDYFIVWCNTNYEADLLKKYIPQAIEVRGSEKPELKKRKLLEYGDAKHKVIITKPSIAGFGLNWQHCNNVVFVGLSYSFEDLYQALRRSYRFGQREDVNAYIISASTELNIRESIQRKMKQHEDMRNNMSISTASFKSDAKKELSTSYDHKITKGDGWEMHNGDCVEVMKTMADGIVDFSIFSPPFANLYIYSDSLYDMGNCSDTDEFFRQFKFLAQDLLRITRNGRLAAVHCTDLHRPKYIYGKTGIYDFPGDIIKCFEAEGWQYHSRVTIWKDPVTEMQRTKAQGLLHKQVCKDSTLSRQGMPDYLVVFRKWDGDENINPVNNDNENARFDYYIGEDVPISIDNGNSERSHSIEVWQRYASPVWFDIRQGNVLNVQQARTDKDERHLCPLQLDVIKRAVHLWTNRGDTVFSPFAGIGSEGVPSLEMGRKFVGVELKESYFNTACGNLNGLTLQANLFDGVIGNANQNA